ncbi:elongation factor P [Candidatus Nomurabacteria bacterium]|nr:elongation factor P [Candidatus Nomurabacteria bacterium]
MAILSYNEILTKKVIVYDEEPFLVLSHHVFRKQQRKPVNVTKLKSLISGRVVENTFHVNETAEEAELEKKPIVYIYKNKGEFWFHEVGNPSTRFALSEELVGAEGRFLKERSEVDAILYNDEVIGINIPIKVELKVTEAMEAVKGNTSSGAQKEVTLETGATIMVPMFINQGDVISINTESGEYSERMEKA